jgi:hypothetical protein
MDPGFRRDDIVVCGGTLKVIVTPAEAGAHGGGGAFRRQFEFESD